VLINSNKILTIKSDKSELKKVEQFLSALFDEYNLPKDNYNRTLLCVSEAVINSIEHGNRNDRGKKVIIEVECRLNQINVRINDEGEGFDFSEIEDPTIKANIRKESGRGIFIIKSLSDSLKFNKKGNSIQLKIDC
jgi:serine/threonine-protein kinase RsbW